MVFRTCKVCKQDLVRRSHKIQRRLQAEAAKGGNSAQQPPIKRSRLHASSDTPLASRWRAFAADAAAARRVIDVAEGGFAFRFVEGALVAAVREGHWLLLDEVNLAPPQVLERIMGLLEGGSGGGLVLLERGDSEVIPRHPDFRLIAAMNPATDAGKRHLPRHIREHFTELYVGEPDSPADLVRPCACCTGTVERTLVRQEHGCAHLAFVARHFAYS